MAFLSLQLCDEHFLVIDKPAGLLSVPGKGQGALDNLSTLLQLRYPEARSVHRLDMATSGLMVFARSVTAHRQLSMAFERRLVHKRYLALVDGEPSQNEGEIDVPLGADWPQRPRQKVDREQGRPSLTRWRVLQRLPGSTRLELEPVTGRSHQLRVHLQHIGHPIIGDTLYGLAPVEAQAPPRMMLHASVLRFPHPASGSTVEVCCPAPF